MLNLVGVLSAESIIKSWRLAIFVSAVVGAIATPAAEPMAMFLLMLPLLFLYFIAAGIAQLHDKRQERKLSKLEGLVDQAGE